jgi:hypothetical protein
MKGPKPLTRSPISKLFIRELEEPVQAGLATTYAIGEESGKGCFKDGGEVTTLAYGEETGVA